MGRAKAIAQYSHARLDFAELDVEFFASSLVTAARQDRLLATGIFHERLISVVFRPLGAEAISVVSMRIASRKERSRYES